MVSSEILTLNAVICKDVAAIQSVVQAKRVSTASAVRHVNVARMHCAMSSITDRFACARTVTQAMHLLAAHHQQIHAIQTHADLTPSANLIAAIQFASVRKA